MATLISWFFKIFNSGYTAKGNQFLSAQANSDATAAPISSVAAAAKFGKLVKSVKAGNVQTPVTEVKEFTGDYKALPSYVEACYFDWMAGEPKDIDASIKVNAKINAKVNADPAFERKIIEYLDVLAESEYAGANLIPRVPSVMVQLLKRMHEENIASSELSRIITKDVVLVAAILSEVNSSYYNLNSKVTDLSQAILLVGHNRLRMVLAKLSFTPIYNTQLGAYTKLTASKIWDESQKRALVAYLLAKHQKADPFMAFLAGLMQDVGLMVALRVFDRSSGDGQLPNSDEFRSAFKQKSLILSTRIGQIWSLPEVVTRSIAAQSTDRTSLVKLPLAKVLQKADFISKICILIEHGLLKVDMERVRLILSDAETDCLFTILEGQVNVATIL